MPSHTLRSVLAAAMFLGFSGLAWAQDQDEEPDPVILRIAIADAATTLQKGLAAGERQGKPISAKFEMPDGDLQVSVYTATASGFAKVVLNPKTGAVISAAPITDPDDLAHAKAQAAAMEGVTASLLAVTENAVRDNAGSRAVSVVPAIRGSQPVALVTLQRAKDLVTVPEALR